MKAVTTVELARKVLELLQLKPGEPFDLVQTRDGSILIKRVQRSNDEESMTMCQAVSESVRV